MTEHARDDNGGLIGITNFNYPEEEMEKDIKELSEMPPEVFEAALKVNQTLLRWMWQNGNVKANGIGVRGAVLCWVFLKEMQSMKQADVSKVIGAKTRQSFNRWSINFRDTFNFIRTGMKSDKARETYRSTR